MSFEYFEADSHVLTYNKFRPSPPKPLVERIIQFTSEKISGPLELAVDVGCGSGQSTEVLAPYFKKVLGLDSSDKIIKEARKKCHHLNVFYSTSTAEKTELEDETVNLLTVGQSLHWLDIQKFYSEAKRVLRSNGVLAVYGYKLPVPVYKDNKMIATIIEKYYKDVLGDYTLPQSQKVYLENYTSEEYNNVNFVEGGQMQRQEDFILETEGTVSDLISYVTSWSAFQNYTKQLGEKKGQDILKNLEEEFKTVLGPEVCRSEKLMVQFTYFLLLGRKA